MRGVRLALGLLLVGAPAAAQPLAPGANVEVAVADAAAVFGLPRDWIWRVMAQESGGDPRAISRAGALGLMQLMPATWSKVRARLALGPDPFDIHDNVMAGAAYLREMFDRFGEPGFLAAYNMGPARYGDYVAGRASLPRETRAYLARLWPAAGGFGGAPSRARVSWLHAALAPTDRGIFPLNPRSPR